MCQNRIFFPGPIKIFFTSRRKNKNKQEFFALCFEVRPNTGGKLENPSYLHKSSLKRITINEKSGKFVHVI